MPCSIPVASIALRVFASGNVIPGSETPLATVATSDPQVGTGIQFTRMLPEDIDELRAFLDSAQKSE